MTPRSTSCKSKMNPRAALLSPSNPKELCWEAQQVRLAIARRAYELFESRGCAHGHDGEVLQVMIRSQEASANLSSWESYNRPDPRLCTT